LSEEGPMGVFKRKPTLERANKQLQALHIPFGIELFVPVKIPGADDLTYQPPGIEPPFFENGVIKTAHVEAWANKRALIMRMMAGETDERFNNVRELLRGLAKEGRGLIPIIEGEVDLSSDELHRLIAWTSGLASTTFFFENQEFGERPGEMELHYHLAMTAVAHEYATTHGGYSALVLFSTMANYYLSKTHGQLDEIVPHALVLKESLLVR
jgi:hypothetical protein